MIFEYTNYKKWVNDRIAAMPKSGRGQYQRIVERLSTNSSIVTQIFRGDRELTPEQAVLLSEHFGLSKWERQYLLLLVNYSRAGTHRYKKILEEEIKNMQDRAREIMSHVPQIHELSDSAKSILYSNWYYLGVWSLSAIPDFSAPEVMAQRLKISISRVMEALEFLTTHGLVREEEGKYQVGPTMVHLESGSPQLPRHHQNWRNRALIRYENPSEYDACYTAPITVSKKDAVVLRQKVVNFISDTLKLVAESPSEELFCLCIDWFLV